MGLCKDQYVAFLNDAGYNVIRLPRAGIDPLLLVGRQNGATAVLGPLQLLVESSARALPPVTKALPVAQLNGRQTDALDAALGIHLLGSFLAAMGAKASIKASYARARTLTFSFQQVVADRALPLEIGEYLKGAELNADNLVLQEYILGNGDLFLITEVIRSSSIQVEAEAKTGGTLALELPELQAAVGANIELRGDQTASHAVTYQGPEPLAFGFMCVHVGVEHGRLSIANLQPGATVLSFGQPGQPPPSRVLLLPSGGLLPLGG